MTKESLEPGTTSIPMTGSTMRDSVPVTATAEIVTMETTTGYTHQSSTPATNISSAPSQLPSSSGSGFNMESFAVDFTISNLIYTAEMGQPDTKTFSNTKEVLQNLLNPLFESGSIGSYYSGCKLTTLRPVKNGTAVNFLCTYWKLLTIPILDKKKIYWELSKQTRKITRLGPHILEKKSLYINGYSDRMTLSSFASCLLIRISTPAPSPVSTAFSLDTFTLNFTITNLRYTTGMSQMGSSKFNSVDNALERLLGSLFAKTTLGSQYVGCKLILLRPLKEGTATGVIFCLCSSDRSCQP
ncbi:mucin-16-like isoform X2 [Phascolarctos cinereus]